MTGRREVQHLGAARDHNDDRKRFGACGDGRELEPGIVVRRARAAPEPSRSAGTRSGSAMGYFRLPAGTVYSKRTVARSVSLRSRTRTRADMMSSDDSA